MITIVISEQISNYGKNTCFLPYDVVDCQLFDMSTDKTVDMSVHTTVTCAQSAGRGKAWFYYGKNEENIKPHLH